MTWHDLFEHEVSYRPALSASNRKHTMMVVYFHCIEPGHGESECQLEIKDLEFGDGDIPSRLFSVQAKPVLAAPASQAIVPTTFGLASFALVVAMIIALVIFKRKAARPCGHSAIDDG